MAWLAVLVSASLPGPGHAEEQQLRLTGIVVTEAFRLAIFADPQSNLSLTVREGDEIGPYVVYRITAREVGLKGSGGRRVIQLGADPAARRDLAPATPTLIDPYRRERESENDQ